MQISQNSPVPDWILELIRVAPEEWLECTQSGTALRRLQELNAALLNPDVLYVLCQVAGAVFDAGASVDVQMFEGFHDILNQQQVIGEKRGLKRILAELDDVRTKLQQIAVN